MSNWALDYTQWLSIFVENRHWIRVTLCEKQLLPNIQEEWRRSRFHLTLFSQPLQEILPPNSINSGRGVMINLYGYGQLIVAIGGGPFVGQQHDPGFQLRNPNI